MPLPITRLRVAVPVPLPRLFDYLNTPENQPAQALGCRVRVPFGHRQLTGIVVAIDPAPGDNQGALKPILQWLDSSYVR